MNRTVTIPDVLYARLEQTAHARGFSSIAQPLEVWQAHEDTCATVKKPWHASTPSVSASLQPMACSQIVQRMSEKTGHDNDGHRRGRQQCRDQVVCGRAVLR
jgi:hypothetical protein